MPNIQNNSNNSEKVIKKLISDILFSSEYNKNKYKNIFSNETLEILANGIQNAKLVSSTEKNKLKNLTNKQNKQNKLDIFINVKDKLNKEMITGEMINKISTMQNSNNKENAKKKLVDIFYNILFN